MNDQSHDAACAINSEITPINSIDHQDVTPLTTNKSSDNVDQHVPADDGYTQPGDQDSSNICVNLDDSKFSSQQVATPIAATTTTDEFNREFTPGTWEEQSI